MNTIFVDYIYIYMYRCIYIVLCHVLQTGQSPLWVASFYGHLKCVELLLGGGANVDVQNVVSVTIAVHIYLRDD